MKFMILSLKNYTLTILKAPQRRHIDFSDKAK